MAEVTTSTPSALKNCVSYNPPILAHQSAAGMGLPWQSKCSSSLLLLGLTLPLVCRGTSELLGLAKSIAQQCGRKVRGLGGIASERALGRPAGMRGFTINLGAGGVDAKHQCAGGVGFDRTTLKWPGGSGFFEGGGRST